MTAIASFPAQGIPCLLGDTMLSADAKLVSADAFFEKGLPIYGQINGELARNNGYVVCDLAQKVLILSDRLAIAYAGRVTYALEAARILYGYEQVGGLAAAELDHTLKGLERMFPGRGQLSLLCLLQETKTRCYYSGLNCYGELNDNGDPIRYSGQGHSDIRKVLHSLHGFKDLSNGPEEQAVGRLGYGTAIGIIAALYQYDLYTARGIEARFGGAYELAFLQNGGFAKLKSVAWVFWAVTKYSTKEAQFTLKHVIAQDYTEGRMLLRTLNGDLSRPALSEFTINNPLLHTENINAASAVSLSTEWQVNIFVIQTNKRNPEIRLSIARREQAKDHLLDLREHGGTIEVRSEVARLFNALH
jgi:hypothetical protein